MLLSVQKSAQQRAAELGVSVHASVQPLGQVWASVSSEMRSAQQRAVESEVSAHVLVQPSAQTWGTGCSLGCVYWHWHRP